MTQLQRGITKWNCVGSYTGAESHVLACFSLNMSCRSCARLCAIMIRMPLSC